jgi:O-acetyl-ADP-ribose deacetylase (regulator of RNase III)
LIASGNYGFPKSLALQIAVREISNFLLENEMLIYLVVFGKEEFVLSEKLYASVSSYIDENYII